jgi:hypothetical protein
MTTAPRIDSLELNQSGLSVSLQTPVVNLTYRTATTTTGTPASGLFYSSIVGRGKMVDLSNDLLPRMGVERIMVQQVIKVDGEIGPNGEVVYKPANDKFDQIRFVGPWASDNAANGQRIYDNGNAAGQYIEVTFYGTGLNLLTYFNGTAPGTVQATIDGTLVNSNVFSITGSGILTSRNYSQNTVIAVASGLTLGVHTAQIKTTVFSGSLGLTIYGFEILNESTTIKVPTGTSSINGKLLTNSSLQSLAYNSGFDSGTLGTRGGRVVVYQKTDGTIGKSVTPTNTSAAYLTSTDHTNEEVIRTYNFREFGAGRSDDFSSLTGTASQRAFTLDDGTTTLVCDSNVNVNTTITQALSMNAVGSFITITFVGTGIDIIAGSSTTTIDAHSFTIDGVNQGSISTLISASTMNTIKVASGLPYGTHTLKIARTVVSVNNIQISSFITYGPKKPTLPSGAVELADYNIMADYSVAGSSTVGYVSQGVLRKTGMRESVYSGTLSTNIDIANFNSGWDIHTTASSSYYEYTFFGTGCDLHGYANNTLVHNQTYTMDGLALNTGSNTGSTISLIATTPTGLSLSAAGVLTGTATGSGPIFVRISGLTLGKHTVRVTANSTTPIYNASIDIITPIHVHKNNGPFVVQNTLAVGSTGINDGRTLPSTILAQKQSAQAVGITNNPSTTSTSLIPVLDMECAIKTTGNPIQISYSLSNSQSAVTAANRFQLYVDGVAVGTVKSWDQPGGSGNEVVSDNLIVPVAAGTHVVQLFWLVSSNTGTLQNTWRNLNVREI